MQHFTNTNKITHPPRGPWLDTKNLYCAQTVQTAINFKHTHAYYTGFNFYNIVKRLYNNMH